MKALIKILVKINPWHFLWVSILLSEFFTYIVSTVISSLLWGEVSKEILIVGMVDSFIVSLLVAALVISFILKIKNIEETNRQLNSDLDYIREIEKERQTLIGELQKALQEVKKLSGFLPICASCKKIRDDKGYWNQIESYLRSHSEAEFSHSICPECADKLYNELDSP